MSTKKNKDIPNEEEKVNTEAENETVIAEEVTEAVSIEDTLKAELAAEKEKYIRLAAEYDNFRKRSQKEREALFTDIRNDTIAKLLPIFDNLERALKQETADSAFFRGVEITMEQLMEIFEKLGVKVIPAVGEKFNPELHNAVMHVENDALGENIIADEYQKGFISGDKVIRFSMVVVAN